MTGARRDSDLAGVFVCVCDASSDPPRIRTENLRRYALAFRQDDDRESKRPRQMTGSLILWFLEGWQVTCASYSSAQLLNFYKQNCSLCRNVVLGHVLSVLSELSAHPRKSPIFTVTEAVNPECVNTNGD
jgi:hypothetical protein